MTPQQLVAAAEAKLSDAEKNLAGCCNTIQAQLDKGRGVSNAEVIALAQLQTLLGQAYATLAMAKAAMAMAMAKAEAARTAAGDGQ